MAEDGRQSSALHGHAHVLGRHPPPTGQKRCLALGSGASWVVLGRTFAEAADPALIDLVRPNHLDNRSRAPSCSRLICLVSIVDMGVYTSSSPLIATCDHVHERARPVITLLIIWWSRSVEAVEVSRVSREDGRSIMGGHQHFHHLPFPAL